MDQSEFVTTLGAIFEHSPWVAELGATQRPFHSRFDLLDAMTGAVSAAAPAEQLALIRAHPRLGVRARGPGQLTPASAREQSRAGLTACTAADYQRLEQLNTAYTAKFNFPFILAVRGHNPASVIEAIERRLAHGSYEEQRMALRQIGIIAGFRLADLLEPAAGDEIAAMARQVALRSAASAPEPLAQSELGAMFRDWMLAAGLNVWPEAGGYLLGQTSGGRPGASTMVLGAYVDPLLGVLWAGGTLDVLVAIGVAQRLRSAGLPHPFDLIIVANPQAGAVRDGAGLLDAAQTPRWVGLPTGWCDQGPGSALRSALEEPSVRAGPGLLVRTRIASGEIGLHVDAAQAAQAVQRLEQSFVAERAQS